MLDGFTNTADSPSSSFDIIDTSNLIDHLGLVNVLLTTRPLLKHSFKGQAIIYTEALIAIGDGPAAALETRLCCGIPTFALLFELVPRPYLAYFGTQSHSHEMFMLSGQNEVAERGGRTQYHERVPWVLPDSCDDKRPITLHCDTSNYFQPHQLAQLLFGVYSKLFYNENPSYLLRATSLTHILQLSYNHYDRATFVTLVRSVRDRLKLDDSSWKHAIDQLFTFIEQDRNSLVGTNYY